MHKHLVKVGLTFVCGPGKRVRIWRWEEGEHFIIGVRLLQAWVVQKYFGKALTQTNVCVVKAQGMDRKMSSKA